MPKPKKPKDLSKFGEYIVKNRSYLLDKELDKLFEDYSAQEIFLALCRQMAARDDHSDDIYKRVCNDLLRAIKKLEMIS